MSQNSKIDWDWIRHCFFLEMTDRNFGNIKINTAPHDLFEWFRNEIEKSVTLNNETTTFYLNNDIFSTYVTACCKIGPITNENYCPNCGKKIQK